MADELEIQEELHPGDLVDVTYEITSANDTIVGLAVQDIKNTLATDPRFDYQGSKIIDASNLETKQPVRLMIITVSVRRTPREERPETQLATTGMSLIIGLGVLIGLVTTAVIAYSGAVAYRSATVRHIADSDLSEASKQAAFGALRPRSMGTGIAAAGSSLAMAAIIIAVLWVLGGSRHRQIRREYY